MRITSVVVAMVLFATPLFGQLKGHTRVNVFASDVAFSFSEGSGADLSGGIGVSLTRWFSNTWAGELSVEHDRFNYQERPVVVPGEVIMINSRQADLYPVDALAQFYVPTNRGNWRPYLGAGVRYLERPDGVEGRSDSLSAQLNAGVMFHFTPRLGIRFDGRFLLRSHTPEWDDSFKTSAGLSWRF